MKEADLPFTNKQGYYEIRLESIGGLGANLCGKMLGELGVKYLGLNSASFSSYGSEKTGTPVKAYIRYCSREKNIRVHAPIKHPHLLCIFHEALLSDPEVLSGCDGQTVLLINTLSESFEGKKEHVSRMLHQVKAVYTIPAQRIAMETHARVNTVMLGAMARVMGFVPLETVQKICEDTLGKKYPEVWAMNLDGMRRGYEETKYLTGMPHTHDEKRSRQQERTVYMNNKNRRMMDQTGMPIGGINPYYGNSVTNDLSASRQGYIPVLMKEKCINCGLCDSTCPDMVFQFGKGIYQGKETMVNQGLDYYHCKGCLRCVAVCPTQALVRGEEAQYPDKPWFMPDQELLHRPEYYAKSGPDGYITSESYLTEKRFDGGEV